MMITPDERIEKLKRILTEFMATVHDTIVDISDESKAYYSGMLREFNKYERQIRRV